MTAQHPAKRVLIADPSDKARRALALYLREKGMEVHEASDGSKAAETLLRKPDILLLDLSVPILGADRLVQILRSNPNTKSLPVFYLSDQERSVSGFRAGTDEFLRKPYPRRHVREGSPAQRRTDSADDHDARQGQPRQEQARV